MHRSLASTALHIFTSNLHHSTDQHSPSKESNPPPACSPPLLFPLTPSSSSSSLALNRSQRIQSFDSCHHLSKGQEESSSSRSRMEQRSSPYQRPSSSFSEQPSFSPVSRMGGFSGGGRFSHRGHGRFGLSGREGSMSSGSGDEFGPRSSEDTPSLAGSSSQRSLSSLGDLEEYFESGSIGLGVTGVEFGEVGRGGRSDDDKESVGCLPLSDVLGAGSIERSSGEQGHEHAGHSRRAFYPSTLKSPFDGSQSMFAATSNCLHLHEQSFRSLPASFQPIDHHPSSYYIGHHQQSYTSHPSYGFDAACHPASYPPHVRQSSLPQPTSALFALNDTTPHHSRALRSSFPSSESLFAYHPLHNAGPASPPSLRLPHYVSSSPFAPLSHHDEVTLSSGFPPVRPDTGALSAVAKPPSNMVVNSSPSRTGSLALSHSTSAGVLKASGSSSTLRAPRAPPQSSTAPTQSLSADGNHENATVAAEDFVNGDAEDDEELHDIWLGKNPKPIDIMGKFIPPPFEQPRMVTVRGKLRQGTKLYYELVSEILQIHETYPQTKQDVFGWFYGVDRSTISKVINPPPPKPVDPKKETPEKKEPPPAKGAVGRGRYELVEAATNEWLDEEYRAGRNPSDTKIRAQALTMYEIVRENEEIEFKASTKWLAKFKVRRLSSRLPWLPGPIVGKKRHTTSSSKVKSAVPSPLPRSRTDVTIASPTPRRAGHPSFKLAESPAFGVGASSSLSSSVSPIFDGYQFQPSTSLSLHESSPQLATTCFSLSSSVSTLEKTHLGENDSPASSISVSRSSSSPNITGRAGKRTSTGRITKTRPPSLSRGSSFYGNSELRERGSPRSSRPGLHAYSPESQAKELGMTLENNPRIGCGRGPAYQQLAQGGKLCGGNVEGWRRGGMGQSRAIGQSCSPSHHYRHSSSDYQHHGGSPSAYTPYPQSAYPHHQQAVQQQEEHVYQQPYPAPTPASLPSFPVFHSSANYEPEQFIGNFSPFYPPSSSYGQQQQQHGSEGDARHFYASSHDDRAGKDDDGSEYLLL